MQERQSLISLDKKVVPFFVGGTGIGNGWPRPGPASGDRGLTSDVVIGSDPMHASLTAGSRLSGCPSALHCK